MDSGIPVVHFMSILGERKTIFLSPCIFTTTGLRHSSGSFYVYTRREKKYFFSFLAYLQQLDSGIPVIHFMMPTSVLMLFTRAVGWGGSLRAGGVCGWVGRGLMSVWRFSHSSSDDLPEASSL